MPTSDITATSSAAPHLAPWAERANYYYRLVVTGFTWALFGLGALVVLSFVLTVLNLLPGTRAVRALRVRRAIRQAFRFFAWWGEFVGLFTISVRGLELVSFNEASVIIANHPSLIDVVLLVGMIPDVMCIVKQSIFSNPFFAHIARTAQYIENSNSEQLIEDCVNRVEAGHTLMLFPEGTRSPRRGLQRFNRGAAHIAMRSGAKIQPVVIRFSPPALLKGQPWYSIPERKISIDFEFRDPIDPAHFCADSPSFAVAARKLTSYLERYYQTLLFPQPRN